MLSEEDVDSWNKLFPDCQINRTILGNPTEHFLINALVSYLRRFGFKVEPPFNLGVANKENNKETRLFLIKLTRQIDHFLKITDKTYSFTYYDLIRPTPKKTAHMLYILLNYYYYYNLYKEDVFKMSGERIHKLEELRALIDKTQYDIKHKKEENKNLKSTIEDLIKEISVARTELKELDDKRTHQEEEFQKLSHSHQELKEKLKHLEEQKKLLRKSVVTEEEFQELQNQLQQFKLKLSEYKEKEINNVANLNECSESNTNLQKLSEEIKKAHEIIPKHRITNLQETKKQLHEAQKEEYHLKDKENVLLQEIEEENVKKLSLEKEYNNKRVELETKHTHLKNTVYSKENILKEKHSELLRLEEEDHVSECHLEEQKDISEYLLKNITEIFSAYND